MYIEVQAIVFKYRAHYEYYTWDQARVQNCSLIFQKLCLLGTIPSDMGLDATTGPVLTF